MKKQLTFISTSLVLVLVLSACGAWQTKSTAGSAPIKSESSAMQTDSKDDIMTEYKKITPEEARNMMAADSIVLDVRTIEEFEQAHIPNAILLPLVEIADKATMVLPHKDQTILVYCRSGNRSETAAKELISQGYKNVYDFGGIDDWTGETVSGMTTETLLETKTVVKNPAPAFVFTDFEGNTVSLADFEGKPVYVKFWASWCSICRKSLPVTDALFAMEKDFEVITVVAPGFSGEKSAADFKQWYEALGYKNIMVLFDEDGTYMKEFGVRAFPSSAHIGADGSLIQFTVGHSSNDAVIKIFNDAANM